MALPSSGQWKNAIKQISKDEKIISKVKRDPVEGLKEALKEAQKKFLGAEGNILNLIKYYSVNLRRKNLIIISIPSILILASLLSVITLYFLKLRSDISDSTYFGFIYILIAFIIILLVCMAIIFIQNNKNKRVIRESLKDMISYLVKGSKDIEVVENLIYSTPNLLMIYPDQKLIDLLKELGEELKKSYDKGKEN